jgi:hypothetical protein
MTPLWYIQQVEGQRTDLTGLFPLMVPEPGWQNVVQVAEQALASGRPVFLIKSMEGLEIKFDLLLEGNLVRVVGRAAEGDPQHSTELDLGGAMRLQGADVGSALEPGAELQVTLYWEPLRELDEDYTSYVQLLDAEGRSVAQSDRRPGGVYYPTSIWRPGERLRDVHRLDLPQAVGPEPHTVVTGFYLWPSMEQLGEPLRVTLPQQEG